MLSSPFAERGKSHYQPESRRKCGVAPLFLSSEVRETVLVEQRQATADGEQDCWEEFPNMCYTVREALFG